MKTISQISKEHDICAYELLDKAKRLSIKGVINKNDFKLRYSQFQEAAIIKGVTLYPIPKKPKKLYFEFRYIHTKEDIISGFRSEEEAGDLLLRHSMPK